MRVCFQLQVKPSRIAEYRSHHAAVWPDMLRALADTGWHNYSLFLREDGLLIGYLETASLDRAQAGMAATEVNARWQAEMGDFGLLMPLLRPGGGYPSAVRAWAATLAGLLDDPAERNRLAAAARRRVEDFTPDKIVPQWLELVGDLLGDRR